MGERILVRLSFSWLCLLCAVVGSGASAQINSTNRAPTSQDSKGQQQVRQPTATQLRGLELARTGVLNPDNSTSQRRVHAEQLYLSFLQDIPQAESFIVGLLTYADDRVAQFAVASVVAVEQPALLSPAFVGPLMVLLGAEEEGLRAQAAQALSHYPSEDVAEKLGALATDEAAPLDKRLAAVEALLPNIDRRIVMGQLIGLLDSELPKFTEPLVEALTAATNESFGDDLVAWRSWWTTQNRDESAWRWDRLVFYRDQSRTLKSNLETVHAQADLERDQLQIKLTDFQRDIFRGMNSTEQREARLNDWLKDELAAVRRNALDLIIEQIGEQGYQPSPSVLQAVVGAVEDESPQNRLNALAIVKNAPDPNEAYAGPVLDRLLREEDDDVKREIYRTIARLAGPEALAVLMKEIATETDCSACVQAGVAALSALAARISDPAQAESVIRFLNEQFAAAPPEDSVVRASLLSAMADLADPTFNASFRAAITSDDPALLTAAARGLSVTGDSSELLRLRTLANHADAGVRRAAIEAVGKLGHEDADAEVALSRLKPSTETDRAVRDAAWDAFRSVLASRPISERLDMASRLVDLPDRRIAYLTELKDQLVQRNENGPNRAAVLTSLAGALFEDGRFARAVGPLTQLYDAGKKKNDPAVFSVGLQLLEARIKGKIDQGLAVLIDEMATQAADDQGRSQIVQTLSRCLADEDLEAEPKRARDLLTELGNVSPQPLGDDWSALLKRLADRINSEPIPPLV